MTFKAVSSKYCWVLLHNVSIKGYMFLQTSYLFNFWNRLLNEQQMSSRPPLSALILVEWQWLVFQPKLWFLRSELGPGEVCITHVCGVSFRKWNITVEQILRITLGFLVFTWQVWRGFIPIILFFMHLFEYQKHYAEVRGCSAKRAHVVFLSDVGKMA